MKKKKNKPFRLRKGSKYKVYKKTTSNHVFEVKVVNKGVNSYSFEYGNGGWGIWPINLFHEKHEVIKK